MTRKIAMWTAAGLVGALLAGMVALSVGRGVVKASPAAARTQKPIVKTITKVVTIKKKPKAPKGGGASGGVVTIVRPAPTTSMSGSGSFSGYEGEHETDHGGGDD